MKRNTVSGSGQHKIRQMQRGELRDRLLKLRPLGCLLPRDERPLPIPAGGGTHGS